MANKLSLKIDKTHVYMIFRKNNANKCVNNIKIQIGNETIQQETSTKFLGMYIDDQLKWTTHMWRSYAGLSIPYGPP